LANVRHDDSGNWYVNAGPGDWAGAWCARWSNFSGLSNTVAWLSGEFSAHLDTCVPIGNQYNDVWGWWGDAASVLTKIYGEFEGGGERVTQFQSHDPFAGSRLNVTTNPPACPWWTSISGGARSIFVGTPNSGKRVTLVGHNNNLWVRGDATSPGLFELSVSTQSGFSSSWLAPTDMALCYLTQVSGNFDGGAEEVHIFVNGNNWFIRALAAPGKAIFGKARCMSWNQSPVALGGGA
jgi:hypothetical protein